MHYSQAGGGGPQGVENRAGSAKAGFRVLGPLGFAVSVPSRRGRRRSIAAVRHALARVAGQHGCHRHRSGRPPVEQGHDPVYAAAFMTAALGRPPDH